MNWRYPLTNLGQKREREKTYSPPVPTATVRDADGNVILFFSGEPHRRNKDAVKNATQFCEEMNKMHLYTGCGDIAYIRDALERLRDLAVSRVNEVYRDCKEMIGVAEKSIRILSRECGVEVGCGSVPTESEKAWSHDRREEKLVRRDCVNWSGNDHCAKTKANHCQEPCCMYERMGDRVRQGGME